MSKRCPLAPGKTNKWDVSFIRFISIFLSYRTKPPFLHKYNVTQSSQGSFLYITHSIVVLTSDWSCTAGSWKRPTWGQWYFYLRSGFLNALDTCVETLGLYCIRKEEYLFGYKYASIIKLICKQERVIVWMFVYMCTCAFMNIFSIIFLGPMLII